MSSERKKYFSLAYDAERARSINGKPYHKIFHVHIFLQKNLDQ